MTNHNKNSGILPPNEDKTPNTRDSSEYSPNYYQKITKALFPYAAKGEAVETTLNDNHGFLADSLIAQTELLRDLGRKINGNEEIEGNGLAGVAENLITQLNVLIIIQAEYYTQTKKQKEQYQKIIADYERTIATLKGGAK